MVGRCITEPVKTLCGMCLKEVNVTVECAWDYSLSCLAGRLRKAAALKNGVNIFDKKD